MGTTILTRNKLKILMLEDTSADVFFYSDLLKKSFKEPVTIDVTSRLRKARNFLDKNVYDLIILDLNLVDSDGPDTVKVLRSMVGDLIPIIVLTGSKNQDIKVSALLAGADDYMVKRRDDEMLCERIIHYTIDRYAKMQAGHVDSRFLKL